jgi:flagellar assembly protein FliH
MSSKLLRGEEAAASGEVWRPGRAPAQPVPSAAPGPPSGSGAMEAREVDARVAAAYKQGFAAAEAAAAKHAAERLEPAIAAFNAVIQELAGARRKFRAEAEQDTVKLAIAIARRVVYRELSTDPDAILGLVLAAFQKLNARETHRLRVSPKDAATIEQSRARLELPPRVEIVADSSLAAGSAIFETSRGELDASVDTQLAEIDRGFADIMRRRAQ